MHEVPIAATGVLQAFCADGMLRPIDFHLARRLASLAGEADPEVHLAFALAARELRLGSVCLDLATAASDLLPEADLDDGTSAHTRLPLAWPPPDRWIARVAASPAVAGPDEESRPFRLHGTLLYLDRYWKQERRLARTLRLRSAEAFPSAGVRAAAPPAGESPDPHQEAAVAAALTHGTTVITGGPGTGKTSIVARILESLAPTDPLIALAAPTGKAAARLQSAVGQRLSGSPRLWGGTLHKLLGARPRSTHLAYGPGNPLPHDVVVVDETSMVSLELMGHLTAALAPHARLILLGDPHQLRSVEAGAVLADIEQAGTLVTEPGGHIARLHRNFRSNLEINRLAECILAGDADGVRRVVEAARTIELIDFDGSADPVSLAPVRADLLESVVAVVSAAGRGDAADAIAALSAHRILCGHREGPFGVGHWARAARSWLATQLTDYGYDSRPYIGQPLLIQRNTDLFHNGDTAVVVTSGGGDLVAAVDRPDGPFMVAPSLLDDATDLHAMTIHKSQGSQFDAVSVVFPPSGSALLTRELIYTAVTRARERVRMYGSWERLEEAIATPVRRASGLARH